MSYQIHVHEDGDTEIRQIEEVPSLCTDLVLHTIEDVSRELKDYGHDEDRINEALMEVSNTSDWVEV
jgi:hypothetical protein